MLKYVVNIQLKYQLIVFLIHTDKIYTGLELKSCTSRHLKLVKFCSDIFLYISSKMQHNTVYLHLETALRVSGGISTHHQEHTKLYLQYLVFVKQLLVPAAIAAGSSNGVTRARCCRYSCMCSW